MARVVASASLDFNQTPWRVAAHAMEQVLDAGFDAERDLEVTQVRAREPQADPRAQRPEAVLIPADPSAMQQRVCGLTVLSRLICSLDRASAGVHILVPPDFPTAVMDEARQSADSRPNKPKVQWPTTLASVPSDRGLWIALRPAVLDHRVCEAVETIDHRADQVVGLVRSPAEKPVLWYVGARRVPELLQAVKGRADVNVAIDQYLSASEHLDHHPGAELCETVSAGGNARSIEEKLFTLARKASDTWIARVFDRRVSLWFTRRLVPFDITPNQITIGSTAIGLVGGLLLAFGTYWPVLIGAILLTLAIIVDGCDGEVARIKYMDSDFGRKLDFFLDNVVNVVAIFTVGAGHYWQGGPFFYLWASSVNAAAALGSVFPVYWLFFRKNKEAIRLGAPLVAKPRQDLLAFAEDISGRDFAYFILGLAVIGRAHWFTVFAVFGLTVFFFLVLGLMLNRMRQAAR